MVLIGLRAAAQHAQSQLLPVGFAQDRRNAANESTHFTTACSAGSTTLLCRATGEIWILRRHASRRSLEWSLQVGLAEPVGPSLRCGAGGLESIGALSQRAPARRSRR